MVLAFLLLTIAVVLGLGALYQAHIRSHLPHDLRKMTTEGLPSEASIRSGELGLGAGSTAFRNIFF